MGFARTKEFFKMIASDNSLRCLIREGKLRISEGNLNQLVQQVVEDQKNIEGVSLELKEGFMDCTVGIRLLGQSTKVLFTITRIVAAIEHQPQRISFELSEIPMLEFEGLFKRIFLGLTWSVLQRVGNTDRLYSFALKDLDGVSILGTQVTVDLEKVWGISSVLEYKMMGMKIIDFIRIDSIEICRGEIVICGCLHNGLARS